MNVDDIKLGTGTELARGQQAILHYQAALEVDALGTDAVLESSLDGRPLSVIIGGGDLADEIEAALLGTRVGGTRRLVGEEIVFEFYVVEASNPSVDPLAEWERCATAVRG